MDSFDLLEYLESQTHEEARAIAQSLLRLGADHWQHDYQATQGDQRTKWLDRALDLLVGMHQGAYGLKVPKDYLAQAPQAKQFKEPMPWEAISTLTHRALRTMFRMPDYSCGSLFYPDTLDKWLLSDNRGSKTSCFLRMLASEAQAPEWTLADLAKAPSKERALIARVKDALPLADVEGVYGIYMGLDNPIQEHTFWGRVGQVAAWLQDSKTLATRDQFGEQESREPSKRHCVRWGIVSRLPTVVGLLVTYNGQGRGWFPVPGEREWQGFLESVAMDTGVYLYTVEIEEPKGDRGPAMSGVLGGGEAVGIYLSDVEETGLTD